MSSERCEKTHRDYKTEKEKKRKRKEEEEENNTRPSFSRRLTRLRGSGSRPRMRQLTFCVESESCRPSPDAGRQSQAPFLNSGPSNELTRVGTFSPGSGSKGSLEHAQVKRSKRVVLYRHA